MKSDLSLDVSKFAPSAISASRLDYLSQLHKASEGKPKFSKGTISALRQGSEKAGVVLPQGQDVSIPSRDPGGRSIPCRIFQPDDGTRSVKGVFLHIHGGGYVLNTERSSDPTLRQYANLTGYAVISVGYRLAPEHVFPAALEDCCDVADYLVENGKQKLGGELCIISGDSVGGGLTLQTTFHVLRKFPEHSLKAVILLFGDFAPSGLPSVRHVQRPHLVDAEFRDQYVSYYLPGRDTKDLQQPDAAPFYVDLEEFRGRLPRALLLCGTVEALVDDSVMMCVKWLQSGGDAVLKLVPGGFHRFMTFPPEQVDAAREGWDYVSEFLSEVV